MNASELSHVMQTNPAVVGMARLADRRGLRVKGRTSPSHSPTAAPRNCISARWSEEVSISQDLFLGGVDRQAICRGLEAGGLGSESFAADAANSRQRNYVDPSDC